MVSPVYNAPMSFAALPIRLIRRYAAFAAMLAFLFAQLTAVTLACPVPARAQAANAQGDEPSCHAVQETAAGLCKLHCESRAQNIAGEQNFPMAFVPAFVVTLTTATAESPRAPRPFTTAADFFHPPPRLARPAFLRI